MVRFLVDRSRPYILGSNLTVVCAIVSSFAVVPGSRTGSCVWFESLVGSMSTAAPAMVSSAGSRPLAASWCAWSRLRFSGNLTTSEGFEGKVSLTISDDFCDEVFMVEGDAEQMSECAVLCDTRMPEPVTEGNWQRKTRPYLSRSATMAAHAAVLRKWYCRAVLHCSRRRCTDQAFIWTSARRSLAWNVHVATCVGDKGFRREPRSTCRIMRGSRTSTGEKGWKLVVSLAFALQHSRLCTAEHSIQEVLYIIRLNQDVAAMHCGQMFWSSAVQSHRAALLARCPSPAFYLMLAVG